MDNSNSVSQPQEAFPDSPEQANAAPICLHEAQPSHRETDDAYPVIARITNRLRVINCKDDIQWIVQRRQGDQWQGLSFCRTREVLIRDMQRRLRSRESDPLPPVPPDALATLQALPEMHP